MTISCFTCLLPSLPQQQCYGKTRCILIAAVILSAPNNNHLPVENRDIRPTLSSSNFIFLIIQLRTKPPKRRDYDETQTKEDDMLSCRKRKKRLHYRRKEKDMPKIKKTGNWEGNCILGKT